MPIIVIHKIIPKKIYKLAIPNPTTKIHKTFITGCFEKFISTSFPIGEIFNLINLNNCKPNGIPSIVIQSKIAVISHIADNHIPAKQN